MTSQSLKTTTVLLAGMDPALSRTIEFRVKDNLMALDPSWRAAFYHASQLADAVQGIPVLPQLDLLHISKAGVTDLTELERTCEEMGVLLATHPSAPWVVINDPGIEHLRAIFERKGVRVAIGAIHMIANLQWEERAKAAAEAAKAEATA